MFVSHWNHLLLITSIHQPLKTSHGKLQSDSSFCFPTFPPPFRPRQLWLQSRRPRHPVDVAALVPRGNRWPQGVVEMEKNVGVKCRYWLVFISFLFFIFILYLFYFEWWISGDGDDDDDDDDDAKNISDCLAERICLRSFHDHVENWLPYQMYLKRFPCNPMLHSTEQGLSWTVWMKRRATLT